MDEEEYLFDCTIVKERNVNLKEIEKYQLETKCLCVKGAREEE